MIKLTVTNTWDLSEDILFEEKFVLRIEIKDLQTTKIKLMFSQSENINIMFVM